MVVLNQQPASRRARREDPGALPSTWVVARIAARRSERARVPARNRRRRAVEAECAARVGHDESRARSCASGDAPVSARGLVQWGPPRIGGSQCGWASTSAAQASRAMPADGHRAPAAGARLLVDHQRGQARHPPQVRDAGGEHQQHQRPAAAEAEQAVLAAEREAPREVRVRSGASRNAPGWRHTSRQRSFSALNWNAPASASVPPAISHSWCCSHGVRSTVAWTIVSPTNASHPNAVQMSA